MADFDLSLAITADGDQAASELAALESRLESFHNTQGRVARSTVEVANASTKAASALGQEAAAASRGGAAISQLAQSADRAAAAGQRHASSMAQQRSSYTMLGYQIQDITMGVAMGTSAFTILAQQAGQTAMAVQGMGGKFAGVARFIGGPFGSVLIAAIAIIGNLAMASEEAADKQEDLGDMADYVGRAQSQLGKVIDLVTGKFSSQNEVVREAIRLQAILSAQQAHKDAQEAGKALAAGGPKLKRDLDADIAQGPYGGPQTGTVFTDDSKSNSAAFKKLVADYNSNAKASVADFNRSIQAMAQKGQLAGVDINATMTNALKLAAARGDIQASKDIQKVLAGGAIPDYLKKTGKPTREKKPPKAKDMSGVEEFGEDAAAKIARVAGAFASIPPQQAKVANALAEMDDLLDDIARKKPPGFQQLIKDGEAAKDIIRDGINQPYREFLKTQEQSLAVARLVAANRLDEAEALRIIQGIEANMGALSQERKDAILASVQAIKAEQAEAEKLQAIINRQVTAIQALRDGVRGLFSSGGGGLAALPGKIMGAVEQYVGDYVFDKLFGDFFKGLEDQAKGSSIVETAAGAFRDAIENEANPSLDRLAEAANKASAALGSTTAAAAGGPEPVAPLSGDDGADIVVKGKRLPKPGGLPTDPAAFFSKIVSELAKGVLGKEMATTLGNIIGPVLKNAALGNMGASLVGNKPGVGSSVGGAIGGALGKAVGPAIGKAVGGMAGKALGNLAGPLGSVLGGVAGSMLGKLFGGKAPVIKGSTTITNANTQGTFKGTDSVRSASNALAGSVQGGLLDIASQLGGGLGDFNVSVGSRHGDYRVDPTGRGATKIAYGAVDFNQDQAAAISFAISDAIKDGAITGLSDAVKKALAGSEDIQRAIREAVKVQNLEVLLGGIGSAFEMTFRQVENAAKENVRLAKTYGLDMAKVEALNAKQRMEAFENALNDRIGSLKELLSELNFGDLFEGTLMDKRGAIQGQIAQAQADMREGKDGAAQRLAELERSLLEVSREAFGTAGPEYGGDLAAARQAAEQAIAQETARAREAQERAIASLNAETQQVALANEANAMLAQQTAILGSIRDSLGGLGGQGGAGASGGASGGGNNFMGVPTARMVTL